MTLSPATLPAPTSLACPARARRRYDALVHASGQRPVSARAWRACAFRLRLSAVYAAQAGLDQLSTSLMDRALDCTERSTEVAS